MTASIVLVVIGLIFINYDFTLIFLNPGTFLDNLTSFTHIWSLMGIVLILSGIYRWRKGRSLFSTFSKRLKLTIVSLISIIALISIINLSFILTPKTVSMNENSDYLILLGGGIDKNGKLPSSVMNRVNKAAEYLEEHSDTVCVVTGGTLKWLPFAEAPEIKRQLEAKGIESERILVEDQALDTIQNFIYSCSMLADYSKCSKEEILRSRIVVVTNGFHLRRAERLANRMGFENVKGISAPCSALYIPQNYLREICAYVKLNMRIILTGKPEHI